MDASCELGNHDAHCLEQMMSWLNGALGPELLILPVSRCARIAFDYSRQGGSNNGKNPSCSELMIL